MLGSCDKLYVYNLFFTQNTAYVMHTSDWTSDVCSFDLHDLLLVASGGNHCLLGPGAPQLRDAGQREGADRGERGHHRQGAADLQAVEGIAASVLAGHTGGEEEQQIGRANV